MRGSSALGVLDPKPTDGSGGSALPPKPALPFPLQDLSISGAAAEEDLECWKECIEYDSVCDDEHAPVRRHLAQFNLGYSSAKSHISQSVSERKCSEISTCAEQRYMQ